MLPNFLVIGAGKAGTTSLYKYLQNHPQIFMPATKELHFFTEEFNWDKGRAWYEQHFADVGNAIAVGEASPSYTRYPLRKGVAERIAGFLPEARLVYLIRNPIDRTRSAYMFAVTKGLEDRDIDTALRADTFYLDASFYSQQIEQYLPFFPRESLLVITAEKLRQDPGATMQRVYGFLKVDTSHELPAPMEFNRTDEKRMPRRVLGSLRNIPGYQMLSAIAPEPLKRAGLQITTTTAIKPENGKISEELEAYLTEAFREDVVRLRDHLGADFHCWGLA